MDSTGSSLLDDVLRKYVTLFKDEKILKAVSRRYVSFFMEVTASIIVAEVFFYIIVLVLNAVNIISADLAWIYDILYSVMYIILVLGILAYILGYFYCRGHLYIITNQRVIVFVKFLSVSIRELEYPNITDVFLNIGPVGRLLNYGNIVIVTAGLEFGLGSILFSIRGVEDPLEVRSIILSRIKEAIPIYEQQR